MCVHKSFSNTLCTCFLRSLSPSPSFLLSLSLPHTLFLHSSHYFSDTKTLSFAHTDTFTNITPNLFELQCEKEKLHILVHIQWNVPLIEQVEFSPNSCSFSLLLLLFLERETIFHYRKFAITRFQNANVYVENYSHAINSNNHGKSNKHPIRCVATPQIHNWQRKKNHMIFIIVGKRNA